MLKENIVYICITCVPAGSSGRRELHELLVKLKHGLKIVKRSVQGIKTKEARRREVLLYLGSI